MPRIAAGGSAVLTEQIDQSGHPEGGESIARVQLDGSGSERAPNRPLRILSLDGGGIRGIASLEVLAEIMRGIQAEGHLKETPKPCDWFDLMVGTSTGGIIALMLGRLKMSVDEAIAAYQDLAEKVFWVKPRSWSSSRLSKSWRVLCGQPRYSSGNLEEAVRKIAGEEKLADPVDRPKCRVAATAVRQFAADSLPDLFRTYTLTERRDGDVYDRPPYDCSIVDAARATSAATTYFPPAKVNTTDDDPIDYLDGGQGYNNPTSLAVQEAEEIWGRGCRIGCIVSIGTGMSPNVVFEGHPFALALKLLRNVWSGTKAVHQSIERRFGGEEERRYFRFDPPMDLASIELDEWQQLDDVGDIARAYVAANSTKLNNCVSAISHPVEPPEPLHNQDQPPPRILALDGGGIRCMASLIILRNLMRRIQAERRLTETPKPCDWFDLMVGTSGGGIIALMLGRLKMSVDEAIGAYQDLTEKAFRVEPTWGLSPWLSKAWCLLSGQPRYSVNALEKALREIAGEKKLADPADPADPADRPNCRVATVVVLQSDVDGAPQLIRTYTTTGRLRNRLPYDCTVVDAARAACAATMYFPPAKVQVNLGNDVTYLDGAHGYNNPTSLAVWEAEEILGRGCRIGCVVSIGTGMSNVIFEGHVLALALKLLPGIWTGSRAVHESMERLFNREREKIYFRFDAPNDIAKIGVDEWRKLDHVKRITGVHLDGEQAKIRDCATKVISGCPLARPVVWRLQPSPAQPNDST